MSDFILQSDVIMEASMQNQLFTIYVSHTFVTSEVLFLW